MFAALLGALAVAVLGALLADQSTLLQGLRTSLLIVADVALAAAVVGRPLAADPMTRRRRGNSLTSGASPRMNAEGRETHD
jgi:ABC-type spermidine/putrescine transport system permease subunit II